MRLRRMDWRVGLAVGLLHLAAVAGLVRAFAPGVGEAVVRETLAAFTVEPPPEPPSPAPPPVPEPTRAVAPAAAAPAGRRATPRPVAAPVPRIVIASQAPAAPVAGAGADNAAGASTSGSGTGAGGSGSGTGGGGGGGKAVKIAGDINSARDYPAKSRELRLGDYVIVALTVGADGRVKGCRVNRASRDAEADRITCRLATERFRFRPATDGAGRPVEAIYGWRQRWFDPREKNE